ncbi:MAG: hypothetical protein JRJ86_00560 [Deltaproteobacteria bacterium]|nr:hypothetical protein [Deltaproteobacteria bacterium]MBW2117941.1 hypothetical protein [Deltaproteobacteria bacterium]MBW2343405.1 hypothetical protein [Deltaproteobacteria bacterium]
MSKIRRGNYVFLTWKGDHSRKHVHVYRNGELVLKWDLEHKMAMKGKLNKRLLGLIQQLEEEGLL